MEYRHSHHAESAHVLYHVFRHRKDLRPDDVADAIGVPEQSLQKYILGVRACPVDVLRKIFTHTKHPMIKELLEPDGWELVPAGEGAFSGDELLPTVDKEFLEDYEEISRWQRMCEEALKDERLSREELREIQVQKERVIAAVRRTYAKILSCRSAKKKDDPYGMRVVPMSEK